LNGDKYFGVYQDKSSSSSEESTNEFPPILNELGIFSGSDWDKFKVHLASISEGEDSAGQPLPLVRYATFLEMHARLQQEEEINQKEESSQGEDRRLKELVADIGLGKEGFFDSERCLKCIDDEMRKAILENVKNVENGVMEANAEVFKLVLPRVLEKMQELLENFQNLEVACSDVNILVSSSPCHTVHSQKCGIRNPLFSSRCCSCCCYRACCCCCCQSFNQQNKSCKL
jgi:hypothetical protein